MTTIGLFQWIPILIINILTVFGKLLLKAHQHITKDLLPYGKLVNIHFMESNFIHKRPVFNGKFMLIGHMKQYKYNKLWQTNSFKRQDNLKTNLVHSINIKNIVFIIIKYLKLHFHLLWFTDLIKLSQKDYQKNYFIFLHLIKLNNDNQHYIYFIIFISNIF
jgi:hypothetical protein